jgi:hypothetical protein
MIKIFKATRSNAAAAADANSRTGARSTMALLEERAG